MIIPGILPSLYNDGRILLGWAWTYLIVAEVVGVSSGITFFINQQAKYRNFDNVYKSAVNDWAKYDNEGESPILLEWGENQ